MKLLDKVCPINHHFVAKIGKTVFTPCIKERCAWYDPYEDTCAILNISIAVSQIGNSNDSIACDIINNHIK